MINTSDYEYIEEDNRRKGKASVKRKLTCNWCLKEDDYWNFPYTITHHNCKANKNKHVLRERTKRACLKNVMEK